MPMPTAGGRMTEGPSITKYGEENEKHGFAGCAGNRVFYMYKFCVSENKFYVSESLPRSESPKKSVWRSAS